jgi:hypothetical protein
MPITTDAGTTFTAVPGIYSSVEGQRGGIGERMPPIRPLIMCVGTTAFASTELPPITAEPGWRRQFNENAERLRMLPVGWDGPGSVPVRPEILYTASRIMSRALEGLANAKAPFLVPGGDGSVQIEWHEKRGEVELDIARDGSMTVWGRDHLSGAEFEGENEAALDFFFRWAPRLAAPLGYGWHAARQENVTDLRSRARVSLYQDAAVA